MVIALLVVVLLLRRVRQLRDRLVSLVLFDGAVLSVVVLLPLVFIAEACGQHELCVIDAFDCFLEFALRLYLFGSGEGCGL